MLNEFRLFTSHDSIMTKTKTNTATPLNKEEKMDYVIKDMHDQLIGGIDHLDNLYNSEKYKKSPKFIREIKGE